MKIMEKIRLRLSRNFPIARGAGNYQTKIADAAKSGSPPGAKRAEHGRCLPVARRTVYPSCAFVSPRSAASLSIRA